MTIEPYITQRKRLKSRQSTNKQEVCQALIFFLVLFNNFIFMVYQFNDPYAETALVEQTPLKNFLQFISHSLSHLEGVSVYSNNNNGINNYAHKKITNTLRKKVRQSISDGILKTCHSCQLVSQQLVNEKSFTTYFCSSMLKCPLYDTE